MQRSCSSASARSLIHRIPPSSNRCDDEVADGALDDAAAELEVLTGKLRVVHHLEALGQVVGDLVEALLLLGRQRDLFCSPAARGRSTQPCRSRAGPSASRPSRAMRGCLRGEGRPRLPQVFDNVDHVERVLRLGEELPGVALEVFVAVGHDLHVLARSGGKAALVRLASSDGEGMALRSVGGVLPAVDRPLEHQLAVRPDIAAQRVHDDDGRHPAVLGLVALLPPRLASPTPTLVSATMPGAVRVRIRADVALAAVPAPVLGPSASPCCRTARRALRRRPRAAAAAPPTRRCSAPGPASPPRSSCATATSQRTG